MGKRKKRGTSSPSLYYDVRVKRFRDRKGRFVSMAKALEYLLSHNTVPVRGRSGKFYRSSVKQAQSYMQHIVKNVWIPRRDIRTDTFAIDVTPYFVFDSEGIRCKNSERIYTIIEAIQKAYERRYNRRRYYLYFEGEIIDVNTGNREGTLQISSKQLTERHETWNYVLAMIEEFEEKVNREIYKFSRSRLMLEMDHVSLVFKGWNKKE
jgi:hypothetical protein